MLNPIVSTVLCVAGGLSMLGGLVLAGRAWRAHGKLTARGQVLFYAGAAAILVGLQPIRPFRLELASPYLLPPSEEARARLLHHLGEEGWVVGAANPPGLIQRDHPLQREILLRFVESPRTERLRSDPNAPTFVFVGRKTSGWSRNPETTMITFVFIAFVLILSGTRRALHRQP